jgi:hypothetical protein
VQMMLVLSSNVTRSIDVTQTTVIFLSTGHMNCYFRLASQFRTQDEPAYCGLATLIMVLNALEIDPGRVWKG